LDVVVRDESKRQYWRRSGWAPAVAGDTTPDDTRSST
jgi:hypothetical protein